MPNWKEYGIPFENFTEKLTEEWLYKAFTKEECKEWLDISMKETDARFCAWLQNEKKLTPNQVINYEDDVENLRKEYEEQVSNYYYGECAICKLPNINFYWCRYSPQHFQDEFKYWTSGNPVIDNFIQKSQLEATTPREALSWKSYDDFIDIEHIADGGFGKVYKAKRGNLLSSWIEKNKPSSDHHEYTENDKTVILKTLNNSQNITADFLQEIINHKLVGNFAVVECLGISQDPTTKNYIMVMQYIEGGNLRQHLNNNQENFYNKYLRLSAIITGLKSIHEKGLVHGDFHPGNILIKPHFDKESNEIIPMCYITDLGLCRPANETDNSKVFGVLPYVAPEVLQGQPYTQVSDIYSLGIIAYELFSGLPPYTVYDEKENCYQEMPHDLDLTLKICEGLRPNLDNFKAPQLLKDLISQCWDAEPLKRPTTSELENFYHIINNTPNLRDTEFGQQVIEIKRAEVLNELSPLMDDLICRTHSQAVYKSRLLPTREITQQLKELQVAKQQHATKDLELDINNFNLDELSVQEDPQVESFHQAQIQIPPK